MAVFPDTISLPENRADLEALIEAAIARLDGLDGDPDLEPSVASPEPPGTPCVDVGRWMAGELERAGELLRGELHRVPQLSQAHWAQGTAWDEVEEVCEDEGATCEDEGCDADAEPSLGSLERIDQGGWGNSNSIRGYDLEDGVSGTVKNRQRRGREHPHSDQHSKLDEQRTAPACAAAIDELRNIQRRKGRSLTARLLVVGGARFPA